MTSSITRDVNTEIVDFDFVEVRQDTLHSTGHQSTWHQSEHLILANTT